MQNTNINSEQTVYWSEAREWLGYTPQNGDSVVIPENLKVILDENTPELNTLAIDGIIEFARKDLTLTADNIIVNGEFWVGSQENPFTHQAEIILTGKEADADIVVADYMNGMQHNSEHQHHFTDPIDNKALIVTGKLELHGVEINSWTQLDGTVKPGAEEITLVEDIPEWKVGDVIAIAPTDFDAYEVEEVTITGISGRTVTFDKPLQFLHYGEQQSFDNGVVLDMRAEVANLTRNIKISGRDEGEIETRPADIESVNVGYGGHTIYLPGSEIKIDGVEFAGLGITGESGRYPVHFHHTGDVDGSYVKNSSVHHTLNRGIVIHQTNELLVEDNTVFDTVGHQYYLEDGIEINNKFYGNLGMLPRETPQELRIDLEDEKKNPDNDLNRDNLRRDERASTFWITNAANEFVGNHAVAVGHGQGFWFTEPDHNTRSLGIGLYDRRKQMPMQTFKDNVAHTIAHDQNGNFNLGYGPEWTGVGLDFTNIRPDYNGKWAGVPNAPVENFTAWKVTNMAVNAGQYHSEFIDLTAAEARELIHVPQGANGPVVEIVNPTLIGETENNPTDRDVSEYIQSFVDRGGFSGPLLAGPFGGRQVQVINGDIYGADEFVALTAPTRSADLLHIDAATEFHSENTGASSNEGNTPTVVEPSVEAVTLTATSNILDETTNSQVWSQEVTISGLSATGETGIVTYARDGFAVDGNRYDFQIDYDPISGTSEQIILDFEYPVSSAQLEIGLMSTEEWNGLNETGRWIAYDEVGAEIADGILDPDLGISLGSNNYSFEIDGLPNTFSQLTIEATAYGNGSGGDRTSNNSDFNLRELTYSY